MLTRIEDIFCTVLAWFSRICLAFVFIGLIVYAVQTIALEAEAEPIPETEPVTEIVTEAPEAPAVTTLLTCDELIIPETEPVTEAPVETFEPDADDVVMLARLLYGEARGISDDAQKAAVVWCVLNRADAYECSIAEVVTAPHQFAGYNPAHPVLDELRELAADVLTRWHNEKAGAENVGRVLPASYLYFTGDGVANHFTNEWRGGNVWDWSLPTPYVK